MKLLNIHISQVIIMHCIKFIDFVQSVLCCSYHKLNFITVHQTDGNYNCKYLLKRAVLCCFITWAAAAACMPRIRTYLRARAHAASTTRQQVTYGLLDWEASHARFAWLTNTHTNTRKVLCHEASLLPNTAKKSIIETCNIKLISGVLNVLVICVACLMV